MDKYSIEMRMKFYRRVIKYNFTKNIKINKIIKIINNSEY